jgi:hypothetical protein
MNVEACRVPFAGAVKCRLCTGASWEDNKGPDPTHPSDPVFKSCEMAVRSWAEAKGFLMSTLFGTP